MLRAAEIECLPDILPSSKQGMLIPYNFPSTVTDQENPNLSDIPNKVLYKHHDLIIKKKSSKLR